MIEAAAHGTARIFIVDDQVANTALLTRTLQRFGYDQVQAFTDPVAAMAAFHAQPPDLLMLDLNMPGRDGYSILQEIGPRRADGDLLPVLVMTGDVDPAVRQRALDLGADDFLTKPFDLDDVILRTRNLLYTRRLHQALVVRNAELVSAIAADALARSDERSHRALVAAALARLVPSDSIDSTASAICTAVLEAVDAHAVSILEFSHDGSTMVVASAGGEVALRRGRPVPADVAQMLRDRSDAGLWVAEPGARGAVLNDPAGAATTRVHAPIHIDGGGPVAGLVVVDLGPGRRAEQLATRVADILAFSAIAGGLLGPLLGAARGRAAIREGIREVIDRRALRPVFQPIVDLVTSGVVGHEALTRFADGTPPDRRFAEAAGVDLGIDLEVACLESAVLASVHLPSETFLSLNVSPEIVLEHERLARLLRAPARPVVLEITEHAPVDDYDALRTSLRTFAPAVQVAIDDAGAGYASFRHIVELQPDFVKLDIGLVRSLDQDAPRRALIGGIDYFALKSGCRLIAEGIETQNELMSLQDLSVELGQGYLLGRPAAVG
jgi:EAL domain-containing protein (putative c-di-GMP-specific phosphodiesterase class I)/DNA-binding response OmpR family regulator